MILGFRLKNYRSFRDETVLTTIATRLDTGVGIPTVVANDDSTRDVLPVIALLGANASGKSNLLRALDHMRSLIVMPKRFSFEEGNARDPFRFNQASLSEPTEFELEFVLDGVRYLYGFELGDDRVNGEWLYTYPFKRQQIIFEREDDTFQFGKSLAGPNARAVADVIRIDELFLPTIAMVKTPELHRIRKFFQHGLRVHSRKPGIYSHMFANSEIVSDPEIFQLLRFADLGITSSRKQRIPRSNDEIERYRSFLESRPLGDIGDAEKQALLKEFGEGREILQLVHSGEADVCALPLEEESFGTLAWLDFLVPAFRALQTGGALLVDELDMSLHPTLVREAIGLFQNRNTNLRGGQLIFTTHDATLLGRTERGLGLSRGQIWFAEKDDQGCSSLTPLSDFKPRKGEDLEKGYLQGRYGGVPRVVPGLLTQALTAELKQRQGPSFGKDPE